MKKLIAYSASIIGLGCASMDAVNNDMKLTEKYPQCYAQSRIVFDKCVEMNHAGKKVNALQVEQIIRQLSLDDK